MRYLWQAILHRFYMGYWPTQDKSHAGHVLIMEEYNWGRREMDNYIDPIIHQEINKLLADILEE